MSNQAFRFSIKWGTYLQHLILQNPQLRLELWMIKHVQTYNIKLTKCTENHVLIISYRTKHGPARNNGEYIMNIFLYVKYRMNIKKCLCHVSQHHIHDSSVTNRNISWGFSWEPVPQSKARHLDQISFIFSSFSRFFLFFCCFFPCFFIACCFFPCFSIASFVFRDFDWAARAPA